MLKFLRNPEIKQSLWIWLLWIGCCSALAFGTANFFQVSILVQIAFSIFTFCISVLSAAIYFKITYQRYEKLANLSKEIDNILYNNSKFELSRFAEGELSILQSEIYKMTIRLREQADTLQKDKTYLMDSITDISHQIRTPLTSIRLILTFLTEEDLSESKRLSLVKEMYGFVSNINWLIDSLLKISKLDAGVVLFCKEAVQVKEAIQRAAEAVAVPMELKEQQLKIFQEGEESFYGDLLWTAEAIGNILKNCTEHTPEKGCITIYTRETIIFTEIEISDNGFGIAPEDLPYLFERFYKGKTSSNNNVGIGLALAKSIILAQGGTLKAANKKEGGAVFTIRFYKSTV